MMVERDAHGLENWFVPLGTDAAIPMTRAAKPKSQKLSSGSRAGLLNPGLIPNRKSSQSSMLRLSRSREKIGLTKLQIVPARVQKVQGQYAVRCLPRPRPAVDIWAALPQTVLLSIELFEYRIVRKRSHPHRLRRYHLYWTTCSGRGHQVIDPGENTDTAG